MDNFQDEFVRRMKDILTAAAASRYAVVFLHAAGSSAFTSTANLRERSLSQVFVESGSMHATSGGGYDPLSRNGH